MLDNFELTPEELNEDPGVSIGRRTVTVDGPPAWMDDADRTAMLHAEEDETIVRTLPPPGGADAGDETEYHGVYTFNRIIGAGGSGEVWEAVQNSLNRRVAVKLIRQTPNSDEQKSRARSAYLTQTFRQEALTTACLDHPNIVPVYDLGADAQGQPMIAMKLVEGTPWDRMLKEDVEKSLSERLNRHLPILLNVGQALAFAHARGVIHRDVKPAQVMVGEYGEVLLMDWGLACAIHHPQDASIADMFTEGGRAVPLAQVMNPAGTPAFMAPEQAEKTPENLGVWTDIFLLGATLFLVLTNETPYTGKTSAEVLTLARDGLYRHPEEVAKEKLPPELVRICLRAMARKPWDRYPSMKAMVQDLDSYITGAGKRRESMELTNEATELLATAEGDYGVLTAIIARLDQAKALYPANGHLPGLLEKAHVDFARAALKNGDLTLARFQAAHIAADMARSDVEDDIQACEDARFQEKRRARIFTIATGILILVAMIAVMIAVEGMLGK